MKHLSAARLALAFASLFVFAQSAHAQTQLRWKFEPGQKRQYVMSQKTESSATFQGQSIDTNQDVNIEMDWEIGEVGSDGSASLTQTMTRIQFRMESPVAQLDYDSADEAALEGPMADVGKILSAMVNAPIKMTISPLGDISGVKVPEEMVKAISSAGPAAAAAGNMFNEEGLEKMMSQSMLSFPEEAMETGKTWETKLEVPAGPFGSMLTTRKFTYEGPDSSANNAQKINVDVDLQLKLNEDAPVEMTLKDIQSDGVIFFNSEEGYLQSTEVKQTFTMLIAIQGQEIEQSVQSHVTMKEAEPATVNP